MSLFSKELVEIEDQGRRYILCNNPDLEKEKGQTRENLKQAFEQEILMVKQSWQKRKTQNLNNIQKIKSGNGNKKLVTQFSEKKLDDYKFRAKKLLKRYKTGKFYSVTINNDEFTIHFSLEEYKKEKSLDGKYIIESTVSTQVLNTTQVRDKYKALQQVEHAFRDLKKDKINIRPIYHRNEAQTRGHVFVCMFAYAIVKEIETLIFPWLKEYNKQQKSQLSYNDVMDELRNIKMSELEIGYQIKKLMIPQLTPIQLEIMKTLNLKLENMNAA